jgi:hypothetical protein
MKYAKYFLSLLNIWMTEQQPKGAPFYNGGHWKTYTPETMGDITDNIHTYPFGQGMDRSLNGWAFTSLVKGDAASCCIEPVRNDAVYIKLQIPLFN